MSTMLKAAAGKRNRTVKSLVVSEKKEAKTLKKMALKSLDGKAFQLCLEAYRVDDVLRLLPSGVRIDKIELSHITRPQRITIEPPAKLRELFARIYHRMTPQVSDFDLTILNTDVPSVRESVKAMCEHYSVAERAITVKEIRISSKDGATLVFKLQLKSLPSGNDLRVKTRVLGLDKINRDPELETKAKELMSQFELSKYRCAFKVEEKRIAICSKE